MSVSLFLYSPNEVVPHCGELRTRLEGQGWHLLWIADWWNLRIADDGHLHSDLIIGCKISDGIAQAAALVAKNDRNAIESLLGTKPFGNCGVVVDKSFAINESEVKWMTKKWGAEAVGVLRSAKTMYTIEFRGTSTAASGYLADDAWKLLGKMVGGLLEDPQTGQAKVVAADIKAQ